MKAKVYDWLFTGFFWVVQLNDLWRVLWFYNMLMQDGALAAWLMTIVTELGMGLLSLGLLQRITANNERPRRDGKPVGRAQPTGLLWFSVLVLGALETFISVSYFYEFGQVTRLTARLLGGDTLWTAVVFGAMSTVLTAIFSMVEGERTRIATAKEERAQERAERKAERERKRRERERERLQAERERTKAQAEREQERLEAERLRYVCERCGARYATSQALAGHARWCSDDRANGNGHKAKEAAQVVMEA